MRAMCLCACHASSRITMFHGADVTDVIEAATACDGCRDAHCAALLDKRLANDPEPTFREMAVWVDPPINQADGEGAE
jgi:hypothetical protein